MPLDYFDHFTVRLPPLPEQRANDQIPGTLDDNIEPNWRMNETLEEMARALFKSWFVPFDPIRTKKLSQNLAYFPTRHSREGGNPYALVTDQVMSAETVGFKIVTKEPVP